MTRNQWRHFASLLTLISTLAVGGTCLADSRFGDRPNPQWLDDVPNRTQALAIAVVAEFDGYLAGDQVKVIVRTSHPRARVTVEASFGPTILWAGKATTNRDGVAQLSYPLPLTLPEFAEVTIVARADTTDGDEEEVAFARTRIQVSTLLHRGWTIAP